MLGYEIKGWQTHTIDANIAVAAFCLKVMSHQLRLKIVWMLVRLFNLCANCWSDWQPPKQYFPAMSFTEKNPILKNRLTVCCYSLINDAG
jgi:hypothetical protein